MTLPSDIYSPDQVSELTMELRRYMNAMRDNAAQKQAGKKPPTPEMSTALRTIYEDAINNLTTPDDLLRDLEALLKNAPVVHLLLASTPGSELKRQLVLWFRTEISPSTLLAFAERRDIGGGVVIRAGSAIYDLSFRKRILDGKQRLTELG